MANLDDRSGGLCGYAEKWVDLGGVDLAEGFNHHVAVLALPVIAHCVESIWQYLRQNWLSNRILDG